MDDDQHLAEQPEPPTPVEDALEQTAVPQLGLSVAVLAAIFVGGALGTVARYQLDAHHPVAQGGFPWVTLLINLSGSLAIGFLVPLTEHAAQRAPWPVPSLSWASWGAGPRTPPWRWTRRCWPGTATSASSSPMSSPRWRVAWPSSSPAMPSDGNWSRHDGGERLLPHPRASPRRRAVRRSGRGAARALVIHHIGVRRVDPLPLGTMLVNASGSLLLGILTGLSLYHGLGPHWLAVAGVGFCGGYTTWSTASWESVHLAADGPPRHRRALHRRQPGRLHRRRCHWSRAHRCRLSRVASSDV